MEDKEKKNFNKKVVKQVVKSAQKIKDGKKNFNKKVVKEVANSALKMGLTSKAAKKIASAAKEYSKGRDLSTPLAPSIFRK